MTYSPIVGCPLCSKHVFSEDLNNHYADKHPEYSGDRVGEVSSSSRPYRIVDDEIGPVRGVFIILVGAILTPFAFMLSLLLLVFDWLNKPKMWEDET